MGIRKSKSLQIAYLAKKHRKSCDRTSSLQNTTFRLTSLCQKHIFLSLKFESDSFYRTKGYYRALLNNLKTLFNHWFQANRDLWFNRVRSRWTKSPTNARLNRPVNKKSLLKVLLRANFRKKIKKINIKVKNGNSKIFAVTQ